MSKSLISIVIPVHNEEGNIALLTELLLKETSELNFSIEIIFVDDGSTDDSYHTACLQQQLHHNIGAIKLSRNFGHQPALLAGMRAARGDAIITMDGDLQHPPHLIKRMVEYWQEGFDVVHTQRIGSSDSAKITKNLSSRGFYKVLQLISDLQIEPGMADFRLISRRAIPSIVNNTESTLFFRGLSLWVGYKQITVPYEANIRHSGVSSYSIKRMLSLAYSGILSFTARPLYWILPFGVALSLLSITFGIYAILIKIFSDQAISGWASLAVLTSFLFGALFIVLGIMSYYLGAIHTQLRSRPRYLISEFKQSSYGEDVEQDQELDRIDDISR